MSLSTNHRAFTLTELMVSLAIMGVLISLILVGLSSARESARAAACGQHLQQIGLAWQAHLSTWKHYPTNGWGWAWVGDSSRGYGLQQPGGWPHNLLPYLDETALHGQTARLEGRTVACELPVPIFNCPSRRAARSYPCKALPSSPRNIHIIFQSFRSDYAACAGDEIVDTPAGPRSVQADDVDTYHWPDFAKLTGVTHVRSQISDRDIFDGTSNQLLVGEKYVGKPFYFNGVSDGDDQGIMVGDDADNRRFTDEPPRMDGPIDDIQHFGAAHLAGCRFVFADGRIQSINYMVDRKVFQSLGNRGDSKMLRY